MATPNGGDNAAVTDLTSEPNVSDLKINNPEAEGQGAECEDDLVDPWNVASKSTKGVDYNKLISMLEQGCSRTSSLTSGGWETRGEWGGCTFVHCRSSGRRRSV